LTSCDFICKVPFNSERLKVEFRGFKAGDIHYPDVKMVKYAAWLTRCYPFVMAPLT
jgi:hypothetical protein